MTAYYNDNDPYCAQWLRNLIGAGLIPHGDVDERSIRDVAPSDVGGYAQVHFFAGLGGWAYAARLAGWPDDRPLWTGSCPCQPFSLAGNQQGFADPRHLWPEFFRLVAERRPPVLFGEQVAGATDWISLVRGDLEALDYAVGAIPVEAASAGADHFRDRYWFVADRDNAKRRPNSARRDDHGWQDARRVESAGDIAKCGTRALADHDVERAGEGLQRGWQLGGPGGDPQNHPWPVADGHGHGQRSQITLGESSDIGPECAPVARDRVCDVVDLESLGWGEGWTEHEFRSRGFTAAVASIDGCQYVECPDGKWRRLPPPRVRWLGNGIPARVAKLRALGNAIDPRVAAEILRAYLEGPF